MSAHAHRAALSATISPAARSSKASSRRFLYELVMVEALLLLNYDRPIGYLQSFVLKSVAGTNA